jgi:MFS family permease
MRPPGQIALHWNPECRLMSYNPRRLFVASCLALITSAFSFQMRQNVADDVGTYFQLTKQLVGELMGGQFLGMALAMLIFSPLCDVMGMGKVLALAWLCHLLGISGTIFADDLAQQGFAGSIASALSGMSNSLKGAIGFTPMPEAAANNNGFWIMWLAAFLIGSANGLVEVAINPLAATLYPDNKTHKLNVLHAWWPGGLIIAGLIALFFVNPLFGKAAEFFNYTIDPAKLGIADFIGKVPSWKFKYGLIYVPMLLYGLLSVGQRFPATERVQANVSTLTMFLQVLRPLFIVLAFCMLLTASTELGTNAWMESVLTRTAHVSGTLVFVYITLLMFILRFFAGPLAHKFSPIGMLFICSILTAAGLYALSFANNGLTAFAAATVFGIGITYYWPTMLGVTAERFPKGGALVLGLMGCVGNLAISQVTPQMGAVYDSYTVANLPPETRQLTLSTEGLPKPVRDVRTGQPLTSVELVFQDADHPVPRWIPPEVSERLFPAGNYKVRPEALSVLDEVERLSRSAEKTGQPLPPEQQQLVDKLKPSIQAVGQAEAAGAAWSFRWTAVMPAVLIVIFGLIGLIDKLRGGYRAVRLTTAPVPVGAGHAAPPGRWPRDLTH